jgi:DNA repair photolyase
VAGHLPRPEYVVVQCKSALNRVYNMPFRWSLNPYAGCRHSCVYCFARQFYVQADHGTRGQFAARILVKENFAWMLRQELSKPTWRGESVVLGTATDPYQPAEGRFRLARATLEALLRHENPFSMLTKSPLVVRDVDLLAALARVASVRVYLSVTTVDLGLWRTVEPGTANPFHRLAALRTLRQAGVPAGVLMAPIMPGLTDSLASIEAVASAAREHGALYFSGAPLRLMPTVKEHYLEFVGDHFPHLLRRYERAYPTTHAPQAYTSALSRRVQQVRAKFQFGDDEMRRRPIAAAATAPASAHPRRQLALPLG